MSSQIKSCDIAYAEPTHTYRGELLRGIRHAIPVIIAVIPFGLVLGAQAGAKGLSILEVPLLTGLNFAGGSEFAAVGLWTFPPHLLLLMGITLLINSRHIIMGATLSPYLHRFKGKRAFLALWLMCDETWALCITDAKKREIKGIFPALTAHFYLGVALSLWVTWVTCTALGAAIGPLLGNIDAYGFDMAFPAVFLVLLRGMWKGAGAALPWVVSGIVAGGVYLLIPGAWYVIAGTLAGLITAWCRG